MPLGSGDEGLSYYAVAVARRDNPSVNFFTLKGTVACFPGEFFSFVTMFMRLSHTNNDLLFAIKAETVYKIKENKKL